MKLAFSSLSRGNWLLLGLFLVAAAASSFFAGRLYERARHWAVQQDEPITGWMSLPYVAHAYQVPAELLHQALGLPPELPDRRSLADIATERRVPLDALRLRLEHAIEQDRSEAAAAGEPGAAP